MANKYKITSSNPDNCHQPCVAPNANVVDIIPTLENKGVSPMNEELSNRDRPESLANKLLRGRYKITQAVNNQLNCIDIISYQVKANKQVMSELKNQVSNGSYLLENQRNRAEKEENWENGSKKIEGLMRNGQEKDYSKNGINRTLNGTIVGEQKGYQNLIESQDVDIEIDTIDVAAYYIEDSQFGERTSDEIAEEFDGEETLFTDEDSNGEISEFYKNEEIEVDLTSGEENEKMYKREEDYINVDVTEIIEAKVEENGYGMQETIYKQEPEASLAEIEAENDRQMKEVLKSEFSTSSALTRAEGSFSTFLAPLNKKDFKNVVNGVEEKLRTVNQTLTMLTNSEGFETILQEMLNSITLKTGELLNADRTTIFLLDEEKNELWSIVAKDGGSGTLEIRIPADKGIAGEVATFKRVVNIPYDFFNDTRSTESKRMYEKTGYRTYTMLALPLLNEEGKLVAVVQLLNKLKQHNEPEQPLTERIDLEGFTLEDERVFEEFAPSIRLILESSRSFYVATQKQRAADALMQANRALSQSSLDLEDTLKRVMDEAKKLMNADRSTLWLIDHERDQLWTKVPINGELKELRIPRTAGFAGIVAQSGEPLIIPFDLYDDPRSEVSKQTDPRTHYRTCSLLCMPVFNANDELIGVTQLVNKKRQGEWPAYDPKNWPNAPECWKASFNRSDLEFMQVFNIQAGVALQNAKLFAEVKQQQQMQRDILRSLSNGVISTDKAGNVLAANESAKKLLGFDEEEKIEGKPAWELVKIRSKEEKDDKFPQWFKDALESDDEKKRQQYYPDQILEAGDNKQHSVNLSINTIADVNDEGKVRGALVVMEDISHEKRLKSTMYRYMTQEVAEQLLARGDDFKMGGDRKEVTVLFSDIRSYTTLTESMDAEEVVQMLNEYFELMVAAVFKHKGTLDKYIGDAIMAVFGAFVPLQDHAWQAVQTAVEMRHRLARFNADRRCKNHQEIKIGIGINSDTVISGNIGSSQRMELTSIGDGVNLGSRLEGASKQYGCDIVISENTFTPCSDLIWWRNLDYIRVKGKTQPVSIYELVGLREEEISPETHRKIETYHSGLKYYQALNFTRAKDEFATILNEIDKNDKASKMYIHRCDYWLDNPAALETEWADGVWSLTEK